MTNEPLFTYPEGEPVILISRAFDAPRDLVWRAMTSPELIPLWWGPRKYETTVEQMDFRIGGKWRFVQRSADGAEHAFFGEYREIAAPEKITQTFGFMHFPPAIEMMTLTAHGQRTRLDVRAVYVDLESRNGARDSGMEGGAAETYVRLEEVLARGL